MQRKDESTPTTSSLAAKGSSTQSTVTASDTGSVPSTAAPKGSTTQTLKGGAKVPQHDPKTVPGSPGGSSASSLPGHIIKGTDLDGQGTTSQSNVAGLAYGQHYYQAIVGYNAQ